MSRLASHLSGDAFARFLGASLVSEDPPSIRMTVGAEHCNFRGTGHGAVIYGIADVLLGITSNDEVDAFMIDTHLVATARVDVGDTLTAVAERLTGGRTLASYRITIRNQDDRVVGGFTGTVIHR